MRVLFTIRYVDPLFRATLTFRSAALSSVSLRNMNDDETKTLRPQDLWHSRTVDASSESTNERAGDEKSLPAARTGFPSLPPEIVEAVAKKLLEDDLVEDNLRAA